MEHALKGTAPEDASAQRRSLTGLSAFNFLIANMLTGFGPFVPVYLAANGWLPRDIGFALSVGTIAAVAAQIPAGLLVDAVPFRRLMAAVAVLGVMAAALLLATMPQRWTVLSAEAMQGAAAALLTPAIAALTLSLAHAARLGEQLGSNVRFQALGSMLAALMMGYLGSRLGPGTVLYVSIAFGGLAVASLLAISTADIHAAPRRTGHLGAAPWPVRRRLLRAKVEVWRDPRLLIFAACCFCFQLGNAGVLPFAMADLQRSGLRNTDTVVSLAIIVSQIVVVAVSRPLGRVAHIRGRRMVLLLAFAALTLRCVLLSLYRGEIGVVGYQVLDGFSGASLGVMVPLMVADITHHGGRFNLGIGTVGLAMMAGATLGTTLAGMAADRFGLSLTFVLMAVPAVVGAVLVLWALPDVPATTGPELRTDVDRAGRDVPRLPRPSLAPHN